MTTVRVRVPATTANLGPGFDALGLALQLHNEMTVSLTASGVEISVEGEGADVLPGGEDNVIVQAADAFCSGVQRLDAAPPRPGLKVHCLNRIPLRRGLGSSSAARVGALVAMNELMGKPRQVGELLRLATQLEGHPDNAAATLLGGLVSSSLEEDGSVHYVQLPLRNPPRFVVLIPDVESSTEEARCALPAAVPLRDAVFNVSHACLLVGALVTGDRAALRAALHDRLHQPYRAHIMPWLEPCIAAALDAGAHGAVLSGAGSCVLALADEPTAQVGEAMLDALRRCGYGGRVETFDVDREGTMVIETLK